MPQAVTIYERHPSRPLPMTKEREAMLILWQIASQADDRFKDALASEYGRNAAIMRHQPQRHTANIRHFAQQYQTAMDNWRSAKKKYLNEA